MVPYQSLSLDKRYTPSSGLLPLLFTSGHDYCFDTGRNDGREHKILIAATIVTCVSFVLQLIAGIICLRALWISRSKSQTKLTDYLIFHTLSMEVVNLIGLVTAALGFQLFFVPIKDIWTKRECFLNDIGPQYFVFDSMFRDIEQLYARLRILTVISNLAFGISGLLTDAMLIWRCQQIWKFTMFARPNLIIVFPLLLFVGSIVPLGMSCAVGIHSNIFTFAYFVITLTLNIILTTLIVLRLWQCKLQLRKVLGNEHGKHYDILSVVFVESASMNAVCSILLLASSLYRTIPVESPIMGNLLDVWVGVTPAVQACSNCLIIYRGTKRLYGSWSNNVTITNLSTAVFATSTHSS
ncbi:hypothetical protein QCA50_016196 [Cerrena zonata]|uniref:Uncharacterized protein n=1 Tax=Cerrena zonata TaxID=2478898 RepID=A0AAW0FJT2_9APHY